MRSSSSSSSSTHSPSGAPSTGTSTLPGLSGDCQSMSNQSAYGDSGPSRSTAHHAAFCDSGSDDRHVVGHDVEHDAEPGLPAGRDQPVEGLLAAELGVERAVVDDVVAVLAAGRGLQVGRAVQVRHPEVGEVRHDRGRVVEAEVGGELHAVGADRHGPAGCGQVH